MEYSYALYGREERRTRQVIDVAVVLFVLSAFVRLLVIEIAPFVGFWFVLVSIGGGSALLNAYWNDGIVMSCLLSLAFVTGIMFGGRFQLWLALAGVAVVLGVFSYAVGRGLRVKATTTGWNARDEWIRRHLFGVEHSSTRLWILIALGVGIAKVGLMYALGPTERFPLIGLDILESFFPFLPSDIVFLIFLLGLVGLAAVPASRGSGLLGSWSLVFVPLFGTGAVWLPQDPHVPNLIVGVEWAFLAALVIAAIFGTIGYVCGRGVQRFVIPRIGKPIQLRG